MRHFRLKVTLVLAVTAFSAAATDIYVNPGSSITNAMAAANPGDTVHVNAGTYTENVQINKSGMSSAYISLVANGSVVINAGGAGKAIRIAASYISVNGFECTNYLEGVNMRTAHIKITNCNFHSGTSTSSLVAGSNGLTVNFDSAIDDIDIENSNFYFNDGAGADFGCNATTDVLTNLSIVNCKFYSNNAANSETGACAIGHQGTKANITVIRCQAYDNLCSGFDMDAPIYMDGVIAHDNDKIGGPNWGLGIKVWGHTGNPPAYGKVTLVNCLAYNNTQETSGGGGINIGGANSVVSNCLVSGNNSYAGFIICSGATLTIKNTILYNEHYSISTDSDVSGLTFDSSNIIYNCTGNGALSPAAAAAAKSFDPQFVNPNDSDAAPWGDFHLRSTSPAIDAGVAVSGLTDDADGNPRPSGGGFDIGPYEFQVSLAKPSITSSLSAGGTVGSAFSYTITASNSPTSFGASGLPGGLSINTSSGVISGTPTAAGNFGVTLSAANAGGTGTATLSLTVNAANVPPVITSAPSASPNPATTGQMINFATAASDANGDMLTYAWSFGDGSNSSGAAPTHAYTTAGSFTASVTVTDGNGGSASGSVSVTITTPASGPNLGFETPSVGAAGQYGSFAYNPAGAGWTFVGQSGISANGSGFTSGNPNAPEGAQVAILQSAGSFSQSFNFLASTSYTFVFSSAQRGNLSGTQNFQVFLDSTSLGTFTPSGTSYADYTTAAIVPGAGSHTLKFVGLNSVGGDNTAFIDNVRIVGTPVAPPPPPPPAAPVINSSTNASGTVGAAFSYTITATNTPTNFSASGLPAGLAVNSTTGVISGTPTASGVFSVTLSAANAGGAGTATLTLTINPSSAQKTLHVAAIAISLSSARSGKAASATVTIDDGNGAIVRGATVTGTWSGLTNATVTGKTSASGTIKFTSTRIQTSKLATFTFTVTSVTLAGYTYTPAQNSASSATINTSGNVMVSSAAMTASVATAAPGGAVVNLGSVSVGKTFNLPLQLPADVTSTGLHAKPVKIPSGARVRGTSISGKVKLAGTYSFAVLFQQKTTIVDESGAQVPAVILSEQQYSLIVKP